MEEIKCVEDIKKYLQDPFEEQFISWRVQSCGTSNRNGTNKPWVKVLAYIDARAVQTRLDRVIGINKWKAEYTPYNDDIICRLSLKIDGEWISKEDGASRTKIESFKGGISGAFKRVAASGWGIGRYLYDMDEMFALCQLDKPKNKQMYEMAKTKDKTMIYWQTPPLPDFAVPKNPITKAMIDTIKEAIEKGHIPLEQIQNHFEVDKLYQLNVVQYKQIMSAVDKILAGKKAK